MRLITQIDEIVGGRGITCTLLPTPSGIIGMTIKENAKW